MVGIMDVLFPLPNGNRNADDMGMPAPPRSGFGQSGERTRKPMDNEKTLTRPPEYGELVRLAESFRDAAFAYLNACDNDGVCSNRTCLRCRIADAAFDVEKLHALKPNATNLPRSEAE